MLFWFNIFNFKIRNWTFSNITTFAESEWNKQQNPHVLLRLSEPVVGVLPNRSEWSSLPWISPVSFKQSLEDYRSALIAPLQGHKGWLWSVGLSITSLNSNFLGLYIWFVSSFSKCNCKFMINCTTGVSHGVSFVSNKFIFMPLDLCHPLLLFPGHC